MPTLLSNVQLYYIINSSVLHNNCLTGSTHFSDGYNGLCLHFNSLFTNGKFKTQTSKRLSPTSATSSWWPFCSRTRAAFSDAYMHVKSNIATSGCP